MNLVVVLESTTIAQVLIVIAEQWVLRVEYGVILIPHRVIVVLQVSQMVELGEQLLICDLGVLMLFRLLRNPLLTENVAAPFYDKIALAPSIILRDSSS